MNNKLAREIASRLAAAVNKTAHELSTGTISDEDDFTSRMLARITDEVRRAPVGPSLSWEATVDSDPDARRSHVRVDLEARRLRSRGRGAEEFVYGADLIAVLRTTTPTWSAAKGVLVQAKLVDDAMNPAVDGKGRLLAQVHKMLQTTPESFVFIYAPGAVRVYNATAVEASGAVNLKAVSASDAYKFFRQFVLCSVGDPALDAIDGATLRELREQAQARHALLLKVKSDTLVGLT